MKCLHDAALMEQLQDIFAGHDVDVNVLGALLMLLREFLYASCQEGVTQVVVVGRVGRKSHKKLPFASAKARFLGEFALGCVEGRLSMVDDTCHQLVVGLPKPVAVLVFHDKLSVTGNGDDVYPIGKLKHKPRGNLHSRRQLNRLLTDIQPRTNAENMLTLKHFPLSILQFLYHKPLSI